MTIGGYEDSLCYEIDRLQADLDKDEEYIEKLEEKNQRLEYLASKAEALEESNHKKDKTIQEYQDYIRELVQSVESQRALIEKLQEERAK
ncbi:MAG: hypothetical protein ACI3X3_07260 [Acidaminococcus sp.]|uniref:hypothetical protein n=1 Tax=Acidaminococcus sp. TaxID=1872103 RepID=UPI0015B3AB44